MKDMLASTSSEPLAVAMLVCHKHIDMVMRLTPPLLGNLRDPHVFWAISDGSLTDDDVSKLREALGAFRYVSREEADDLVAPHLRNRPVCRAQRQANVMLYKLLDLPLVTGGPLALIDSDVTAIRPFVGLDRRAFGDEPLVMMRDYGEAYSLGYQHRYFGHDAVRAIDRANAGFMYCHPRVYDLEFVEWFFADGRNIARSHWLVEQTAWAVLAARVDGAMFDPTQVGMPPRDPARTPPGIVFHFIGTLRHPLDDKEYMRVLRSAGEAVEGDPAILRVQPARTSSMVSGLFRKVAARMIERPTLARRKSLR